MTYLLITTNQRKNPQTMAPVLWLHQQRRLCKSLLTAMTQDAFFSRSATHSLMIACLGTPSRFASLSNS